MDRAKNKLILVTAALYLTALAVAIVFGSIIDPSISGFPVSLTRAFVGDLAATAVVFAGSRATRNSSVYDPYWSVAPLALVGYWWIASYGTDLPNVRALCAALLVIAWGIRLTFNCYRRWASLVQEDFRYQQLRAASGPRYIWVELFGVHLLPTLLVFAGCVPIWWVFTQAGDGLNVLDVIALTIAASGVAVESVADHQLVRHRSVLKQGYCRAGLWRRCRHPNYLGEIMFWWGLAILGLSAGASPWVSVAGAIAINALFLFVSVPMMDRRMLDRHPDYQLELERTPALIPTFKVLRRPE